MPYERSTLISRTGYSGVGADPAPCCSACAGGATHAHGVGDFELTPTTLAVGVVAAWFLFFRKKR